MTTISFNNFKSVYLNNKPIFYHILDNYISDKSGYSTYLCVRYINRNILDNFVVKSSNPKINFCEFSHDENFNLYYSYSNDGTIFKYFLENNQINTESIISNITYNFLIFSLSFNDHSTSLILFKKKDFYHILLCNSGDGLENHLKRPDISNMYCPFISFSTENINLIIDILILFNFYKISSELYKYDYSKKLKILTDILNYLKIKYKTFEFQTTNENGFTVSDKYYNILYKFIKDIKQQNEKLDDMVSSNNIDKLLVSNLEKIQNQETILNNGNFGREHLLDKIKFHLYDKNIYIYTQQSGSCVWFSKYWALCIYYLVFDPDNYYNFIKNLLDKFIELLNLIFIKKNFIMESQNTESCITTMNNIYLKLINLNILSNNIENIISLHNYQLYIEPNEEIKINNTSNKIRNIDNRKDASIEKLLENIYNSFDTDDTKTFNIFFKYFIEYIADNHEQINSNFKENIEEYNIPVQINELFDIYFKNNKELSNSLKTFMDNVNSSIPKIDVKNKYKIDYLLYDSNFNISSISINNINNNLIIYEIINYILIFKNINKLPDNKIYEEYLNLYYIVKYYLKIYKFQSDNHFIYIITKTLLKLIIFIQIIISYNVLLESVKIQQIYLYDLRLYSSIEGEEAGEEAGEKAIFDKIKSDYNLYKSLFDKALNQYITNGLQLFLNNLLNESNSVNYFNKIIDLKKNYKVFFDNIYTSINEIIPNNIMTIEYYNKFEINYYELNEITLTDIDNEIILLLENPSLIFNKYLVKNTFNNVSLLIKLSINNITDITKENLLKYFLSIYIDNMNTKLYYKIICLIHIQLLLFKCHSDIDFNDDYWKITSQYKEKLEIYNYLQYQTPSINIQMLDELFTNIYKSNEINQNKDNFISTILNLLSTLSESKSYLNILLNKHNINIEIDNIQFITINKFIQNLLNITSNSLTFQNKLDESKIYIATYDYYIEIIMNKDDKITEIIYNKNKVLLYENINEPFKKIIPLNCFHFIYKIKNQYHVTYFINNSLQIPTNENILNDIQYNNLLKTIRISKQNNFFPITDDIKTFIMLIYNYGYNMLNFNYIQNEKKIGYYISQNEIDYIKKKFIIDYKQNINIENNEFTLVNEKFTLVDKDKQIDKLVKKDDYLKSLVKLKKKIIKYQFNDLSIITELEQKYLEFFSLKFKESNKKIFEKINSSDKKYFFINNIDELSNYIIYLKIVNSLNEIINSKNKEQTIKIYIELFNNRKHKLEYMFEYIFEFLYGYEILDEQLNKYKEIISTFETLDSEQYTKIRDVKQKHLFNITYPFQIGGTKKPIRIDKFMMGKGKSAVLTPLLALYFSIIHNKTVYIIVPPHLKNQTIQTMNQYIYFFKLLDKIIIMTDTEIKHLYLYQQVDSIINENEKSKLKKLLFKKKDFDKIKKIEVNAVMLIDEFDTIINPLTSNYNVKLEQGLCIDSHLFDSILDKVVDNKPISNEKKINNEIESIKHLLDNDILKENINWGIHPSKGYAIPYLNKNKPNLNATFSSIIMSIYLTLYYYIIIQKKKFNSFIKYYVIHNNILETLFNKYILSVSDSHILEIYDDTDTLTPSKLLIIKNIINSIKLTHLQLNISFIDILLIPDIYKIGYSGTLNINLPESIIVGESYIQNDDYDEIVNVEYAIKNSNANIIHISENMTESILDIFNSRYNAYIDICGIFRHYINENLALELYKKFNRPVIFIDEDDIIKVALNEKLVTLFDNELLDNPIFYYDQAHIVGIDIKQEKYPYLKGLCIIDDKTTYTEIAQGIFRLRKINMGHSIDIFINSKELLSKDKLFDKLNDNERKTLINKKNLLNFQTYKSLLRKKNSNTYTNTNKHHHEEKVKYYFNDDDDSIEKLLENIINFDEDLLTQLKINDKKLLYDLIYNVNFNSNQFEQEQEQQQEQEQKIENNLNQKLLDELKSLIRYPFIIIKFQDIDKYISSPILIEFNEISAVSSYSLRKPYNIYCLPNIFTWNLTGLAFVLINKKKLLLIPGYMIKQFITYNKFAIFNIYLKQINNVTYDINDINYFKEKTPLFNIILNYKIDDLKSFDNASLYILLIILVNDISNNNFLDIIIKIKDKLSESYHIIYPESFIKKKLTNHELIQNICSIKSIIYDISDSSFKKKDFIDKIHIYHTQLSDKTQIIKKKYIKYKKKYSILKNILKNI